MKHMITSVQTQLVDELVELAPQLVVAVPSPLVTWVDCSVDWAHGPAVVWLIAHNGTEVDRVCGACAKVTIDRYADLLCPVYVVVLAAKK